MKRILTDLIRRITAAVDRHISNLDAALLDREVARHEPVERWDDEAGRPVKDVCPTCYVRWPCDKFWPLIERRHEHLEARLAAMDETTTTTEGA